MDTYRSRNPALERAVAEMAGPFNLAARLWPELPRRTGYDRVYKWLARGRVPGTELGPLVAAMRAAGLSVTDDVISQLGGSAPVALTTDCRQGCTSVESDVGFVRQDAA
jgi:hypothetical protein